MDWNGNLRPPFLPRPENSLSFLYNYDHYPGLEMRYPVAGLEGMEKEGRKKRLTSEQLESLERSFSEEIKLDPDRKMKLARELGMQPRQVAVWFQNRRARWKAKQLEQLYDSLKHDFDLVSREKQRLQEEVAALKAMIKDQATKNQVSTGCTQISVEETAESTSVGNRISGRLGGASHEQIAEGNYVFNVDDYNINPAMPPYWSAVLPSYP